MHGTFEPGQRCSRIWLHMLKGEDCRLIGWQKLREVELMLAVGRERNTEIPPYVAKVDSPA